MHGSAFCNTNLSASQDKVAESSLSQPVNPHFSLLEQSFVKDQMDEQEPIFCFF
jgi:hypothetical protein